ncbi:MAG TPA: OmpA family protein [Vicinamibacterales bacterium]|nr:OmpA family protein [Vicinamibacterales bacterium]
MLVVLVLLTLVVASYAAHGAAQSPVVPIVSNLNIVLAVANNVAPGENAPAGILQGDYEMVVTLTNVSASGITHETSFEGTDAAGVKRMGTVRRVVSSADLATAPLQILGFHLGDPAQVSGATALGPSLSMTRALVKTGATAYSFRQWIGTDVISGTLQRSARSPIKFPVLLNGKRVELDAILATGQMALGSAARPFETVILDHAQYPISLRIAYGPRNGGFPFKPDFLREVVRIDFPVPETSIAEVLKGCRVELQGIYFDFNRDTLQPQSAPALKQIADALRSSKGRFTIEGHTDSIGTDRYNDDLSTRRAAAVKAALVREYGTDPASLTTVGYGERRPIETNDTLAGRARNRRVELVCAQGQER